MIEYKYRILLVCQKSQNTEHQLIFKTEKIGKSNMNISIRSNYLSIEYHNKQYTEFRKNVT